MAHEDCSPEELVRNFQLAWQSDREPTLSEYLPAKKSPDFLSTLKQLVVIDLECRWKRPQTASDGETLVHPAGVEHYAERFAELSQDGILDQLAKEEFVIRRKFGDKPPASLMARRFPTLADDFAKLDLQYPVGKKTASRPDDAFPLVDHFEIIRSLGEGGMGSVYLAEQAYPLRRSVALKVIRGGIGSKTMIARFEAERQALAMMDHPHIAKVLDGGVTEDGLPYFAMELVDGMPINEYCDQKQLSLESRLDLFVQTCKAVQHAHQKGILHRDLKPSNVLVTASDGEPCVKVIDFGLAKAFQEQTVLTDRTIDTQMGQIVGTPQYMSPEQSRSNPADIDTRSDVYSLGVMLYELLTGTPPLTREELRSRAFDEVMRAIREDDPAKPSSRVMRLPDANSTSIGGVAKHRLKSLLFGELDWIVMRCLEKDRERRYESPLAVADDLARYRKNEPVDAGPPSAVYRIRKFARRYAGLLTTAAILLTVLCLGAITTTVMGFRAISAEKEAKENLDESERQRTLAVSNARKANALAREGLRQAAALALRQAEASVASDDVERGLAWYSHAMQNAPESENAIKRVARQNLLAWSSQTARPSQTVQVHPSYSAQWLLSQTPVETFGDRVLCRFPVVTEVDTNEEPVDIDNITPNEIRYSVYHQNDLSQTCPPMQPTGDYLNHWVDANSNRLVTLHWVEGDLPTDALKTQDANSAPNPNSAFFDGTVALQGQFIVQQWNLETGQQSAPAIRWFGQVEYDEDPAFDKEYVEANLQNQILFYHDRNQNAARLWSMKTGQPIGPPIQCASADLSAKGTHLAVCNDRTATVYDIADGSLSVAREYTSEHPLLAVSYSDSAKLPSRDSVLAVDSERGLHVWASDERHLTKSFDFSIKGFIASRYSVYVISKDRRILRWNLLSDATTELIAANRGGQIQLIDEEQFVIGSSNDKLKIWNQNFLAADPILTERASEESDESEYGTMIHIDPMERMIQKDFSSGEQSFIVIDKSIKSMSKQVRAVTLDTKQEAQFVAAAHDHSRNWIARVSAPNEISVFSDFTGEAQTRVSGFPNGLATLPIAFSPDHQSLIALSLALDIDGPVYIHRIALAKNQTHVQRQFDGPASIGFHPTLPVAVVGESLETATFVGEHIVGLGTLATLTIRDATSGKALRIDRDVNFGIRESIIPSSSGNTFALCSQAPSHDPPQGQMAATAQRWDAATGKTVGPVCQFKAADPGRDVGSFETIGTVLVTNPDATRMFSCQSLEVMDLTNAKSRPLPLDKPISCHGAAFSMDSSRLAISCSDNNVRVYDLSSLTLISTTDIGSPVIFISYFTNDDLAICTSQNRWFKIVDEKGLVEGGAVSGRLADARISRDGRLLATLTASGKAQVWDCETGQKIGPVKTLPDNVLSKRVDPYDPDDNLAYPTMGFTSDNQSLVIVTEKMISTFTYPGLSDDSDDELARRIGTQIGLSILDGQLTRTTKTVAFPDLPGQPHASFPELWYLKDSRAIQSWPSRYPSQ